MANKKRKAASTGVFPIFKKKVKLEGSESTTSLNGASSSAAPEMTVEEFQNLLDLSSLQTEEEVNERLERISKALLYNFRMAVRREGQAEDVEFDIVEAEFYLQIGQIHEDPFTHGSEEQRFSGRWYFHRAPQFSADSHRSATSATMYRDGTRKGMDLTFGGPPHTSPVALAQTIWSDVPVSTKENTPPPRLLRGGILLRSIRQVGSGNKLTSGPSLLVDRILAACGVTSITELVQQKWKNEIAAFYPDEEKMPSTCLFIKPKTCPSNPAKLPVIYRSPRIGLELSHPGTTAPSVRPLHPRILYLPRRYRFFIKPTDLTANGRPQTFLGVLKSCIASYATEAAGLKKANLSKEITRLSGIKDATAAKYMAEYLAGREGGEEVLGSCIGSKGKGIGSSPGAYLKMMGSIAKIMEEEG
ncbi:hypothetical protein CVT24_011766 [Panaeolus cyanescens]|uniref:Uncharacterized protein n=1 Tax=Panaeolus cyanescens TaxID=181874 RepID=A0A409VHI9_9AGAR|nr:hypothetical protein CVT24_011766 [Panaeolus cyanescens]